MQKTGPLCVAIAASCVLISDMRLAPLHLSLQLAAEDDRIVWLKCRLGENRDGKLVRGDQSYANQRARAAWRDLDAFEWFYVIGYGERTH